MESRIELLVEECLLSRAPNLEANKFAMLSVPDTPSTIKGGIRFVYLFNC